MRSLFPAVWLTLASKGNSETMSFLNSLRIQRWRKQRKDLANISLHPVCVNDTCLIRPTARIQLHIKVKVLKPLVTKIIEKRY